MQVFQSMKQDLLTFYTEFIRIWRASKSSAMLLIILEIFLGSVVVIELSILAHLIDSTIGARSIGVWTSDMSTDLRMQVGLFVAVVVAIHLHEKFKGLASRVGARIREVVFILVTFLASFVASPAFLTLAIIGFVIILYVERKVWRVGYSLAVVIIGASGLSSILHFAVKFDITIGELIWWGGSLLALTGWLALRPHLGKVESRA